jgi:hypothetical protein
MSCCIEVYRNGEIHGGYIGQDGKLRLLISITGENLKPEETGWLVEVLLDTPKKLKIL